jgi:GTPase SAR1 family protein
MITMISSTSLEHFQRQRRRLIALSERLLAVLETLNMPALSEEVRSQMQRLHEEALKVLVVGEFNTGKSTVLNALLGQKILPAYPVPTTALLTEVKWGDQPRAILHYRPSGDGSQKMSLEVPIPELETYLVINGSEENLYERIELFWPLPLCRSGIELLDSPGLDDDDVYLEATMQRVPYVDAILFVLGCETLPTKEESLMIDRMRSAGHDTIFFLCNRFDLVEPSCREMVKRRRIAQLSPLSVYGDQYIFFTNAKGALTGRINGDREQFGQLNLQQVEDALYTFLQARGRDRLLGFARQLKMKIRKASYMLSLRRLLDTEQERLLERYRKTYLEEE